MVRRDPPPWRSREVAILVGVLLAIGVGQSAHLGSIIYSDADEGTYVYAGRLLAEGKIPYRDFLFAHPPLLPAMVAVVWKIHPGIMPARLCFLGLNLLGGAALYILARATFRKPLLALLTVALYMLGMLCVANMGRTVRLEPTISFFLLSGVACLRAESPRHGWRVAAGVLLSAACLVKLVAVVPIALLFAGDLAWPDPEASRRAVIRSWTHVALGAALVLVPAAALLVQCDAFVEWAVRAQLLRSRAALVSRVEALRLSFVRWPFLPAGLLAAALTLARNGGLGPARGLALVALGTTITVAFAFKSYATYYMALVLPWTSLALLGWAAPRLELVAPAAWRYVQITGVAVFGCLGPLVFAEVYHRHARVHVADARRVLQVLVDDRGRLYCMAPDFNLWSGRDLPDWYFAVDSSLARRIGRLRDRDFAAMIDNVDGLLLYPGEFGKYPETLARLSRDFERIDVGTADWELWRRRKQSGALGGVGRLGAESDAKD